MWCEPGEGYSYTSQSPHVASIVLRHLVGMEMQQYIDEKLAKPMGWGQWGYALHRGENTLPHTPGGADTAIRSTDVLRFCLLDSAQGESGASSNWCRRTISKWPANRRPTRSTRRSA